MGGFQRRVVGYLLLSLGLALLVWPFSGELRTKADSLVVELQAAVLGGQAPAGRCPGGVADLPPRWAGEPRLTGVLKELAKAKGIGVKNIQGDWVADLRAALIPARGRSACFRGQGAVWRLDKTILRNLAQVRAVALPREAVGALPSLSESELTAFPGLAAYLAGFARSPSARRSRTYQPERQEGDLAGPEWRGLAARLKLPAKGGAFVVGNRLVWAQSYRARITKITRPAWFAPARYGLGGLLLLGGLFFLRGLYRRRPGINLNPAWAARIGDGIFCLFLGFPALCLLEYLLETGLGMAPVLPDPIVREVCAVGYLPVLLVLAMFAAGQYSASLEIGQQGLTMHGPGGKRFMPWQEVEAVSTSDSYVPVSRVGVVVPRKLQTKLCFLVRGTSHCLPEAGLKSIKRELLAQLERHAPARLARDLARVKEDWRA